MEEVDGVMVPTPPDVVGNIKQYLQALREAGYNGKLGHCGHSEFILSGSRFATDRWVRRYFPMSWKIHSRHF
jgi:hypothetical protein